MEETDRSETLRVTTLLLALIGGLCTVFNIGLAVGAALSSELGVAVGFLVLAAPSIILLIVSSAVTMDDQRITIANLTGRYQMGWNEITTIEFAAGNMVFEGCGKRLSVPTPNYWVGADKRAMRALLRSKAEESGISISYARRAMFKLSQNTRIPQE